MASITIHDLPDEVRDELLSRATSARKSLEEYLRQVLIELADRPSAADWLADVRRRATSTGTILDRDELLNHRDADRR